MCYDTDRSLTRQGEYLWPRSLGQDGSFTGRARDADRQSARKRIFDTASGLFYRKVIRAVGVETIVEEAKTTKMSLYRSFASKDELVAEWLRDHDIKFWQTWDATSRRFPADPRKQLKAAFTLLAKHVVDPQARGCPMANAAVELTDKDHPARKVIEAHKAKLRARLTEMCARLGHASLAYWPTSCFSSWKERRSAPRFWAYAVQQETLIAPPNRCSRRTCELLDVQRPKPKEHIMLNLSTGSLFPAVLGHK